jgi:hypothetical protein
MMLANPSTTVNKREHLAALAPLKSLQAAIYISNLDRLFNDLSYAGARDVPKIARRTSPLGVSR